MNSNYQYPLLENHSSEDLITIVELWTAVEKIYEDGMKAEEFLAKYSQFKNIVKSIGEEKSLGKKFEAVSGYSLYKAVQAAKEKQQGFIKIK